MKFFTWFFNLFKSNKMILQLTVQSIAGELFQHSTNSKKVMQDALAAVIPALRTSTTVPPLAPMLGRAINMSRLLPPEQALVLVMTGQLSTALDEYFKKSDIIAAPDRLAAMIEMLGWIDDMARI